MNVKCYHSLDFASAKKRAFKDNNPIDEYQVQLEDYENINDLIARSIRTKKPFTPETNSSAIYETDEEIAQQLPEYNLSDQEGIEPDQEAGEAKQSDGEPASMSGESTTSDQTL